jgi:hypothetical protein
MSANISCPVSDIKINENRVRLNAFFVLLSALACILSPNWEVPAFLVIDFFLRGFGWGRYSPLNTLSGWVIRNFSIGIKFIDQAPKLFAAQLGFAFSGLLLIFSVFSVSEAGYSIAATLVLFAFLESAIGFCAGCHVYTLTRKFLPTPDIE